MAPGITEPQVYQPEAIFQHADVKSKTTPVVLVKPVEEEATGYIIKEVPLHTRKPFRTVVMGAGYAGLLMGIVASEKMKDPANEFVIYEKNHDMGGTWLENRCASLDPLYGERTNTKPT